jgi:hypothetical protein
MQFLIESMLTATIAGVLGVFLAIGGLDLLKRVAENFIPRVLEISLDVNVLAFAVGLSILTGLILGLVPALHASRSDPIDSLKDSSRGTTGRQAGRLRAGLLVAEVALSLVLLVGAVLLIDSFRRLQNVDPGFRAENVTTFFVGLPPGSYPDIEKQGLFFQNAIDKLKTVPGVTQAAAASNLPASDNGNTRSPAAVEGRPVPPVSDRTIVLRSTISPGFFETFGIQIKQRALGQTAEASDWLIGADIVGPELKPALRSMKAPGTANPHDDQPADMGGYVDGGDVHTNSGIPNRAFSVVATTLGGNSWDAAGPIWYAAACDPRLSSTASFSQFAKLTLLHAKQSYGETSKEAEAISGGWEAVQVPL